MLRAPRNAFPHSVRAIIAHPRHSTIATPILLMRDHMLHTTPLLKHTRKPFVAPSPLFFGRAKHTSSAPAQPAVFVTSSINNTLETEAQGLLGSHTSAASAKQKPEVDIEKDFEGWKQQELERQQRSWEERQELEQLELEWETKSVEKAVDRYKNVSKNLKQLGLGFEIFQGNQLLAHWFEPLCEAIKQEQNIILQSTMNNSDRKAYGPYLVTVSPEKLAVLTMHEVLTHLLKTPEGAKMATIVTHIGRAVQFEANLERLTTTEGFKLKKTGISRRNLIVTIKRSAKEAFEDSEWGSATHAKIGSILVQKLLETATVKEKAPDDDKLPPRKRKKTFVPADGTQMVPAFFHFLAVERGKKSGMLGCNEQILDLMDIEEVQRGIIQTRHMPMLVPPNPWTSPDRGGYLAASTKIMRTKGSRMQFDVLKTADMKPVYECLNILSSTPWRVNQRIYEIITEAWESGGGIADLPSRKNLEVPPKPDDYYADPEVKRHYDKQCAKIKRNNSNMHSLRCDTIYKLQVAKDCLTRTFYFPHNMDFRGRTYPIPPHLNHLGQDLCRGLLEFAEGRPLGKRGLHWLKVHLSNVFGNDKVPFNDRVSFVESKLDEIRDSAERPLDGNKWWLTADKPWECLAASIGKFSHLPTLSLLHILIRSAHAELMNALNTGAPEEYVSTLPIHQDGSCNGLQHYAALGGDEMGARKVNLLPSNRPQGNTFFHLSRIPKLCLLSSHSLTLLHCTDVYSGVVELVVRRINEDAANGDPVAKMLIGKVDRKVIKQTVMTSVYGVTFIGARKQIHNALKDKAQLSEEQFFPASMYLSKATFASIKEMFTGAREIMEWLG